MPKRHNRSDFSHIGNVIPGVIRNCRFQADADLVKVWDLWRRAVGDRIADNATPAAFKGSILIVYVSSSVWMQQLRFLKSELIFNINQTLGTASVADIKFKIGPV